jgi:hypothetical protein
MKKIYTVFTMLSVILLTGVQSYSSDVFIWMKISNHEELSAKLKETPL